MVGQRCSPENQSGREVRKKPAQTQSIISGIGGIRGCRWNGFANVEDEKIQQQVYSNDNAVNPAKLNCSRSLWRVCHAERKNSLAPRQ